MESIKICNRCVMSNYSDETINFDENGYCNYCTEALANKEVSFKLNGILYSALSDKNGIAAISFTNLDVGKYAIYSEYGGCTIKNTLQIK